MIHILKSKSGYRVRYTGKNGEILAVSEVLTSKQNAWKNVRATMKLFGNTGVVVIDTDGYYYTAMINTHTGKFSKRKLHSAKERLK